MAGLSIWGGHMTNDGAISKNKITKSFDLGWLHSFIVIHC